MSIQIVIIFVLALLSVSIIDTLGPIIANKFKFNYAYFIIFSFATYFLSGFFLSMFATANTVLFLSGMVGFYDGTVGGRNCQTLQWIPRGRFEIYRNKEKHTWDSFILSSPYFWRIGQIPLYLNGWIAL